MSRITVQQWVLQTFSVSHLSVDTPQASPFPGAFLIEFPQTGTYFLISKLYGRQPLETETAQREQEELETSQEEILSWWAPSPKGPWRSEWLVLADESCVQTSDVRRKAGAWCARVI